MASFVVRKLTQKSVLSEKRFSRFLLKSFSVFQWMTASATSRKVRGEQIVERKRREQKGARGKAEPAELQTLNFKVTDSFKRAYKVYAAQRGITMLDLLKEGFELSKQEEKSLR